MRADAGDVRIRRIEAGDWPGIAALEARAYAALGLVEGPELLRSRAARSPDTCRVLAAGPRLAGYLLALPCPPGTWPDLAEPAPGPSPTGPFRTGPAPAPSRAAPHPGNLHLHDLVIAPELRRRGLARMLLGDLLRTAGRLRYERVSLVAVGGTADFWTARGFAAEPGVAPPAGYGPHAAYLSRPLTPSPSPHVAAVAGPSGSAPPTESS